MLTKSTTRKWTLIDTKTRKKNVGRGLVALKPSYNTAVVCLSAYLNHYPANVENRVNS
jgi:hypothetical protein